MSQQLILEPPPQLLTGNAGIDLQILTWAASDQRFILRDEVTIHGLPAVRCTLIDRGLERHGHSTEHWQDAVRNALMVVAYDALFERINGRQPTADE